MEFDPATGRRVFHFYSGLPPPTLPDVAVTSNMLDQHGIRQACTPHSPATISVPVAVSVSCPEYSGREEHGAVTWVPDDPGHPPTDQRQHPDVCIPPLSFAETFHSEFSVLPAQSCVLPVLPEETEREEAHSRLLHTRVSRQLSEPFTQASGTTPRGYPPLVASDPPGW